ncbi:MAG TPA: M23 family metallopeptidase [Gemmatimonadales bacterium]|nr:M23 family metallopeptidase [Gemmatimonadales bacterium]
MATSRWTVLFVRHDTTGTRAFTVSGTVLRVAAGLGVVVGTATIVAAIGVVSRSVDLSHGRQLERSNRTIAGEVARLGGRVDALRDSLNLLSRRDNEARLVAGIDPLNPDVERAGIGGPVGPWPDRDRLLVEGGAVGREAAGIHTDLDALIRRAGILSASFKEAAESLAAHHMELEATPTIMPTAGFLSSRFAAIRYHPILHENLPHEGIDIAAPYGTRIVAPAEGRVIQVGWQEGYGLMVVLDHGFGLETRYAHMSRTAAAEGQILRRGDLLGFVGSTGLSTGPHLHYEVRVNGRPVDPLKYILPDDFSD